MARILDSLLGHDETMSRLLEALKAKRLGATLLFVGPSGVGKNLAARGLAQAILCEKGPAACGKCGACIRAEGGQSESLFFLEPEEIQIKIEQVRALKDFVRLKLVSHARVAIVNDAHMMTPQAANSLLKVLEEPPPSTYFILVTGQEAAILPTLRSRSQTVRFAPLSIEHLKKITDGATWALASAQGRADRVEELKTESETRNQAIQGFQLLVSGSRFDAIAFFQPMVKEKDRALKFCQWWQQMIRDCWAVKLQSGSVLNPDLNDNYKTWSQLPSQLLERMSASILQMERDILMNVDRALLFENFWKTFAPRIQES
ncbi:MAG TPA: DNA polymerase III subunit [Bdellovibrionales bacterium]|nr:DNA polymerase III subunit [Bdellovibrionales bacterium]